MKRFITVLMSAMIALSMMPTMAFATSGAVIVDISGQDQWNEFKGNLNSTHAAKDVVVNLSSGTYTTNFKVPGSTNLTINGGDGVVLEGQIALLSSDGRGGKAPGSLRMNELTYKVSDSIQTQTDGVSQTSASGIALWGDQSVSCEKVTFDMSLQDSTAITGWWDTGVGTSITVKDCVFNCAGQRPIRSAGNVTVEGCTFNDPYRYAVQLTAKQDTAEDMDKAVLNFNNNTIVNGEHGKPFVYGVQLEGADYGCHNLVVNGTGNTIATDGNDSTSTMYYCECGKVVHNSVEWFTEEAPVHDDSNFAPVAKIGGIEYTSLAEAINATPNETESPIKISLVKDAEGGVKIGENQKKNIEIDLNGHTYDVKESVGSVGTETNGMQLLKGSRVVIKNGKMKSSSSSVRIFIKNYADLTLENVEMEDIGSALAVNNCGQLKVNGDNTKIISADNVWSITTGNYHHGDIITTEINAGTISSVACETPLRETGGAQADESVTVTINGGSIGKVGEYDWRAEYGGDYLKAPLLTNWKINITGGTFSSDPSAYVANGYVATKSGDVWTVAAYVAPTPTPEPEDPITNTGSGDNASTNVDASDNTTVSDAGKTETTIDGALGDKIVENAKENNVADVVIKAETEKGDSTGSTVALPESTVQALAKDTEASVTIKTDSAEVSLDKAAVDAVAAQAGTDGEVKLEVVTVENTEDTLKVELKLVTSKGTVSDFQGGNVTVTVPVDPELSKKEIVCVYIDDNGKYTMMEGSLAADGKSYTFTTGHFSTYAILEKAKADEIIADQNKPEAKPVKVGNSTVKVYAYKGGKLRVKASAKNATGYKVFYKKSSWKNYKTYTRGKIDTLDKTFKKLSKGKYTVKVKAYYKDYDGTKAVTWGATSKAKTITVKK